MSDNFARRQPTAAEVAHGLGLEVDLLRARIAELEAEVERLKAERWEPVDEWTERCNTIWPWVDLDYSAEPDDAGIMLTACDENGHVTANVVAEYALPPDVRLCRKEARNE